MVPASGSPSFGGLDVIGGSVAVRLDEHGRVRWVRSSLHDGPSPADLRPRITAGGAIAALLHERGRERDLAASPPGARSRLVVLALPAAKPRLAWEVRLPFAIAQLESLRAFVDAQTGAVLTVENMVARAEGHLANVYDSNPVVATTTTQAALMDLPSGATRLEGPDVVTLTCVDERQCHQAETSPGS